MFGIGLWEIIAIAVVALIFVKPDDIPDLLHKVGRWYQKIAQFNRDVKAVLRTAEERVESSRAERKPEE